MNRFLSLLVSLSAVAQSGFAMGAKPEPGAPPPPAWVQLVPFAVMLGVFYMLLIRPQMRQRKEKENMIGNLKKGDKVVTTGGLIVTIMNIGPVVFDVKLNDETKARVLKSSVIEVFSEGAEPAKQTNGAAS